MERLRAFWAGLGARVEIMTPDHHDLVLAITSHLPHLIAYTIVGTADELEEVTSSEVIKFSAGGFRDFTRIAASDPTMWRDVFLANKEAVLEMLGTFNEDLSKLTRAIRRNDGEALFEHFTRTRAIRRGIVEIGQDSAAPDFGRPHATSGEEAGVSGLNADSLPSLRAKRSNPVFLPRRKDGLPRRFAPRNDVDRSEYDSRLLAARCARSFPFRLPLEIRGRGEDRVRAAPAVSRAKQCIHNTRTSIQVWRRHPAFPAQWLYGLYDLVLITISSQAPIIGFSFRFRRT